jgi:UDP-N-acetylglucosamine 2-epimerase
LRVLTVVGARPQFIKAAPVSRVLRQAGHHEFLVHTGQHYDFNMSQIFFEELGGLEQSLNLGVGSGSHASQTAQMLVRLEEVMLGERPDWVLVYGDTNSTLAGALAACKIGVPIAHVESGLRSYNRGMPEEHNRVLADHCADLLLCPTQTAVDNLAKEGITRGVHLVGDTMYDAVLQCSAKARETSTILADLKLTAREYALATVHRNYNTDQPENLHGIIGALAELDRPVVFPVHPRTRHKIQELGWELAELTNLRLIEPVGYFDMLALLSSADVLLTDSGGMQKEAYFLQVPCVTLRTETEWVETVSAGWNVVAGSSRDAIAAAVRQVRSQPRVAGDWFGDGAAAVKIRQALELPR